MPVVNKTKTKAYGHGVGVRPSPWHNGGFHLYEPNCFTKKSFSSSSDPHLYRTPTISMDPGTKSKVFKGTLERIATDEAYRASMVKTYSLLMKRKGDKDLPVEPWRGTRPGLPHPLAVFSYETSLGNESSMTGGARPQSAPASSMKRSRSELNLGSTRWAGPEAWLEGPWKDCGPSGGLHDPFPKVQKKLTRSQSAPPTRRY